MSKSREKLQQIGLWDEEVSSPTHDALCLWSYNNAEKILRSVYPDHFNRDWETANFGARGAVSGWENAKAEFLASEKKENPRVCGRFWEVPLLVRTGYRDSIERIIGYADLVIDVESPHLGADFAGNPPNEKLLRYTWFWGKGELKPILVEVKATLPTFGELMRQINLYRTSHKGPVVVVSKSTEYSELLKEQGVWHVSPDL